MSHRMVSVVRTGGIVRVAFSRRSGRAIVCDFETRFAAPEGDSWRSDAVDHAMREWIASQELLRSSYGDAQLTEVPLGLSTAKRLCVIALALCGLLLFGCGFAVRSVVAERPFPFEEGEPGHDLRRWWDDLPEKGRLAWLRGPAMGHRDHRAMAFRWLTDLRVTVGGHDDGVLKAVETATLKRGPRDRCDKVAARAYLATFQVEEAAHIARAQAVAIGADPDRIEAKLRSLICE